MMDNTHDNEYAGKEINTGDYSTYYSDEISFLIAGAFFLP